MKKRVGICVFVTLVFIGLIGCSCRSEQQMEVKKDQSQQQDVNPVLNKG